MFGMGVNRTSAIAVAASLVVLALEYVYVFLPGAPSPVAGAWHLLLALVNGVVLAFAVLLLVIGVLLAKG